MEGSKYGDIFQEGEQKRHQELQTNLLAIKYVQTVHEDNNAFLYGFFHFSFGPLWLSG